MTGWRRLYGCADYSGWKLYVRGTTGRAYIGHPLATALFWVAVFHLGRLLGGRMFGPLGQVLEVRLVRPGTPTPE